MCACACVCMCYNSIVCTKSEYAAPTRGCVCVSEIEREWLSVCVCAHVFERVCMCMCVCVISVFRERN